MPAPDQDSNADFLARSQAVLDAAQKRYREVSTAGGNIAEITLARDDLSAAVAAHQSLLDRLLDPIAYAEEAAHREDVVWTQLQNLLDHYEIVRAERLDAERLAAEYRAAHSPVPPAAPSSPPPPERAP